MKITSKKVSLFATSFLVVISFLISGSTTAAADGINIPSNESSTLQPVAPPNNPWCPYNTLDSYDCYVSTPIYTPARYLCPDTYQVIGDMCQLNIITKYKGEYKLIKSTPTTKASNTYLCKGEDKLSKSTCTNVQVFYQRAIVLSPATWHCPNGAMLSGGYACYRPYPAAGYAKP